MPEPGMPILDLNKGDAPVEGRFINLGKEDFGSPVKRVEVILTWAENPASGKKWDPDVVAFELDENDQLAGGTLRSFVRAFGQKEEDKNLVSPDGAVTHGGDDTTGATGERIIIDGTKFGPGVKKVRICVTIFNSVGRKHRFGLIRKCVLTLKDADTGKVLVTGDLTYSELSVFTAIDAADVFLHGDNLAATYLGEGHNEGLEGLCRSVGMQIGQNNYDNAGDR